MIYLQFLRKLNQDDKKSSLNISLCMSTITGLAQYLKLLTRYGLHIALERNRYLKTVNLLMKFLKEVEKNEIFDSDPFRYINIPINTNDNCVRCQTYIQDECIQFNEYRWHLSNVLAVIFAQNLSNLVMLQMQLLTRKKCLYYVHGVLLMMKYLYQDSNMSQT